MEGLVVVGVVIVGGGGKSGGCETTGCESNGLLKLELPTSIALRDKADSSADMGLSTFPMRSGIMVCTL
jgi:hypothetical protein